jgi:hypothetical protein
MRILLRVQSRSCLLTQRGLWSVLLITMLAPLAARAENCPWLNAATAGGLLGGEVSMTVTHTSPQDITCEFALKQSATLSALKIEVHTMSNVHQEFQSLASACGTEALPLRAVGNEAVACTQNSGTNQSEEIIARVRERAFLLRWTAPRPLQEGMPLSREDIQDRFRNVAEQVAGSLF